MTAGVIFDCDGVLVDSEELSCGVLAEALTEAGLPTTTEEAIARHMGSSMASVVAEVEGRLGRALPERFVDDYYERMKAAFARELRPVPGILEALDRIDVPACVASSGPHHKIRFTLAHTGLLERFDGRIFSVADVSRGKPAPDLFLHAAARMGFDPARTVVVEDSPRGVEAGVAAGMAVLAYADHASPDALAAAGGRVFTDMRELPELVSAATRPYGAGRRRSHISTGP